MKNYLLPFACVLFLLSCGEKNTENITNVENLTLTKVDSIQVPYFGLLNFMDIHPATERALFFDQKKASLVVSNYTGTEIFEIKKDREDPDGYGSFPLGAGKFSADGQTFTIVSNQGVYTYDLEGNLVHGGKHQREKMPAFSGRASADTEFYWVGNRILTTGSGRGNFQRNTPEFYENYTALAWFDTLERNVEQFMYLDETSFFKNGKAHDIAHLVPRVTTDTDRIYYIVGIEPALNIHDVNTPYKQIKRIPLNIPDYHFNQGEPFEEADPRIINPDIFSGRFDNIKVTDKYILVSFFPGISEREQDKYENVHWSEMMNKTRRDYPSRLLVMDLEGELIKQLEIPVELDDTQWLVRGDYLYFKNSINLEEEEDFVKIYKVKLE
ncbi:hypothetical protein SAMN06295967_1075 [Belliella buryatensis]|uniref:TolB-like 6-blade propeller-like n=1 Tax=Belliella buryatensis TaxID=1500549 RepID=A0A239DEM4_9BACT|nr:hypothetical protein [Belliella buryatensis]SNS30502.1 hypothetical protein SAMN06295967_1075 [Belliella buryatensis]